MHKKCLTHSHHNEEFSLRRPNCGARDASSIQPRWSLHLEGRSTHFSRPKGRSNVNPRVERGVIGHACKGPQNRQRRKGMTQKNRPYQRPKAQGDAIKGMVIGLPTFKEMEINRVCGACQLRKQHRHPFPKERNVSKGYGRSPLGCMGTNTDDHIRRMSVICYLHRRLL